MLDRERVGREASPSAAVIDSQSVKTTEAGGPRGYDAGKKINGRKRQVMVDTDGRGAMLQVHPASIQDRDGAIPLLRASRPLLPFIERVFADSAYAAERVANATRIVEIVRKQAGQIGFAVHPRRWVVERFFAWLGRNRRLAKDFEATVASATAMPHPSCCSLDASLDRFEIRVGPLVRGRRQAIPGHAEREQGRQTTEQTPKRIVMQYSDARVRHFRQTSF